MVSRQGRGNHIRFLIKNDLCGVFYLQSAGSSWRQDRGEGGGGATASLQEAGVGLRGTAEVRESLRLQEGQRGEEEEVVIAVGPTGFAQGWYGTPSSCAQQTLLRPMSHGIN